MMNAMTKLFTHRAIVFDADDRICAGSFGHGGSVSRRECLDFAKMLDGKAVGILDLATGEYELVLLHDVITPDLQRVWDAACNGRIPWPGGA
jgi:hypothetical protein